jgi:hypothetical protein
MKNETNQTKALQQGHLYKHLLTNQKMLAMASGLLVEALVLDPSQPAGVNGRMLISPTHVEPLPMVYFGGRIP